jgi:hypothetical protein
MAIEVPKQIEIVESLRGLSDESFQRIADFVVGEFDGAPRARGSYGIGRLFTRCGIQAEYNGSSRDTWAFGVLRDAEPSALARVLIRLSCSDEYHGSQEVAQRAALFLNRILIVRSVQIALRNGQPCLDAVDPEFELPDIPLGSREDSGLSTPDFEQLDLSADEATELVSQWDEVTKCYSASAFLAAMVMLGSLLESLLLLGFKRNRPTIEAANIHFTDASNRDRPPERWSLNEMIEAACRLGWTNQKLRAFSHSLREYRNLIHAELRRRPEQLPRDHECLIASIIVSSVVTELRSHINLPTKGGLS